MKGLRSVPPKQLGDISVLLYGRKISRSEFPPSLPNLQLNWFHVLGSLLQNKHETCAWTSNNVFLFRLYIFYCGLKPHEMTVYTNSQYQWQTRSQIGDLFNDRSWLLLQRRDEFGYLFTRVAYKNNVLTKQWLVFKSRTIWVDDDSESD